MNSFQMMIWHTEWIAANQPDVGTQPIILWKPSRSNPLLPHVAYRLFLRRTPVIFGANSGTTWAHVDDIAEGYILALDRGRVGELYNLAWPALTFRETMGQFSRITGLSAPRICLPSG